MTRFDPHNARVIATRSDDPPNDPVTEDDFETPEAAAFAAEQAKFWDDYARDWTENAQRMDAVIAASVCQICLHGLGEHKPDCPNLPTPCATSGAACCSRNRG